ncbi:hypothetical protein N7G274_001879 [Stereocaulon virgatum]|uniref:Uncharacterized protein n=1 Tax=Stereocaulon virgatum TaxID=373712 RepID=A0ABR4AKY9_9LECA
MATSAQKFCTNLSKLARDIEELRKDSHGLNIHDKLCSEQSVLKCELQQNYREINEKNQEMANLRQLKDDQIASLCAQKSNGLRSDDQVLNRKYQE